MHETQIPDTMFTTTEAAQRFGKDPSHIRRLCNEHDIGQLKYGRIRLLKQSDMNRLEKYFSQFGRNRKKTNPVA